MWVGHVTGISTVSDDMITVETARVIRRWGTTQGLNQLATGGPRPATQLDAPATVHIARRAIIAVIPCEMTSWTA